MTKINRLIILSATLAWGTGALSSDTNSSSTADAPIAYILSTDFGFELEQNPLERQLLATFYGYSCISPVSESGGFTDRNLIYDALGSLELMEVEAKHFWEYRDDDGNFSGPEAARSDFEWLKKTSEAINDYTNRKFSSWHELERVINCSVVYSFLDGVRSEAVTQPKKNYTVNDLKTVYAMLLKTISNR